MSYRIAVVGATGNVGREVLSILEERRFPVDEVVALASSRSVGVELSYGENQTLKVQKLADFDFAGIDIVLSSPGAKVSAEYTPRAAKAGAVVIDNTSHFRMDPDVPLVVAQINDAAIADHQGIIANPNCTTMTLMMAAGPLHAAAPIDRLSVASYQATGGSGRRGIDVLAEEVAALGSDVDALVGGGWSDPGNDLYARPIGYNVVPLAGSITEDGYTDEEWKLVNETHKILDAPGIRVEPTCVRVPTMVGHGIAATMFFERPMELEEASGLLSTAPGLQVWSDEKVPTPLDSAGIDDVLVGRVRQTIGEPGGISLWVVGDNLRKGAALNAVQIAELLLG